ncbi:MAG: hypothetical protein AAGB24_08865 [Bacteroidota bacterium]
MKSNFIKGMITLVSLGLFLTSCEDDDKLPVDFDDLNVSGAPFIQIINQSGDASVDLFNPAASSWTREYQVVSLEDGEDVTRVELYVSYTDNTVPEGTTIMATAESLYQAFDASVFSDTGIYPTFSVDYNGQEVLDLLGLNIADIAGTDAFNFRWDVITDRGTFTDVSANFDNQSADHTITATVVCLLDETLFTGMYRINQVNPGPFGNTWEEDLVVEVTAVSSTIREFSAIYLPQFAIGNGPAPFQFELVCDQVVIPSAQGSGLQCANGITFGPPATANAMFDFTDESIITIKFTEDEAGDCGPPGEPTITLTKV